MSFLFTANLVSFRPLFGKSSAEEARTGRPEMGLPRERHRVPYPTAKGDILELQICILPLESLFLTSIPKCFFGHNQNSSILLKKHLQHFLQCLVKMNPFRRIFFQLGWIHLTLVDFDWWWEWKATTQVAYMAMTSTYVPSRAFRVSHKSFTHLRWESGQISYPAILQIEG